MSLANNTNIKMGVRLKKVCSSILAILFCFSAVSCSHDNDAPIVIWTDNAEIVSYAEYFNLTHEKEKAIVLYKEQLAGSIPPSKNEIQPDIIIGSWLKNSFTRKYFSPLNYLFQEGGLLRGSFYKQILEYGSINDKFYLIPISFNLPAMMYSKKNEHLVENDQFLTLDTIKKFAGNFNVKNDNDLYSVMGFAPSWDDDFLYLVTKLNNIGYQEKGSSFLWNEKALKDTIGSIKDWTVARNTSTTAEENFKFRYLYMPNYSQVLSGKSLFAYITSDKFFTLSEVQSSGISYKWIVKDQTLPIEDDITTMGLYKKSRHKTKSERFITWFMQVETQRKLLERTEKMRLDSKNFGIAGGFSSLKEVNEKIYPVYYRQLLGNMPPEHFISVPNILPYRWESLKSKVIIPYLKESTNSDSKNEITTLETRIADWEKQYF